MLLRDWVQCRRPSLVEIELDHDLYRECMRTPPAQQKRFRGVRITGNTSGMPPLTALLPSRAALSLSQSFSSPAAFFQLITVAPNSRISTLSPEGSVADTRPASLSMLTVAWGRGCCGVDAKADGLLGRSTMVLFSTVCVGVFFFLCWCPLKILAVS